MTKNEVADVLDMIGTMLELKGENQFRCRAYFNGATAVRQLEGSLQDAIAGGTLADVRGIGEALRDKIVTLVNTGSLPYFEQLRASLPAGLFDIMRLPGMGPKKVKALYDAFGIDSLEKLKASCQAGEVASLKGFGLKTQQKILEGIETLGKVGERVRFDQAYPLGVALLEQVRRMPGVIRAELCGSLRRRRETAKDIDLLVSSDNPAPIMDAFVKLPEVIRVTGHGETKSSVVVGYGTAGREIVLNADLRIIPDRLFGLGLHYFSGSADHNRLMRERALKRGLKLSEYELAGEAGTFEINTEADIFAALGMDYIPPELREATGEIEAAEARKLPRLVEAREIRGVFHNHTTYSDGKATLQQMALAAKALGFEYLGIGDHSQTLKVANGMPPERALEQLAEIDSLNDRLEGIRLLKGVECDVLADGSLDYDDDLLAQYDYVVASVHTNFNMPSDLMTARIIKALAHPAVTMLGHATGRLLLSREGYKVDLDAVIEAAAKYGKLIEINAQPSRLDLDWVYCKRARALGVPLVINPDAHSTGELAYFHFGINVARRGWLEAKDVYNTRPLTEVQADLAARKMKG